jgi:LytS/YehU family sensor histidine kinase
LKPLYIKYFALCLAVIAMAVVIYLTDPSPVFYFSVVWIVTIAILLWLGNRLLTKYLDKKLSWSKWGNSRFFIHLFIVLIYLLLLVNVTYYIIKTSLTSDPPTIEQLIVMNAYGSIIFIPAFSIYFSLNFLRHWQKSELETARYQKETMRSQLDLLKNHIDPHFLFNNLNILSSLIDKDKQASKIFIDKFAEVYRTLLKTASSDLITLTDELSFIQSYIYLIKTRFETNIQFSINVKEEVKRRMIPPLTLQMLIENAIKHNIILENKPLLIEISDETEDLLVSNTLNAKSKSGNEEKEGGSGLLNIEKRYAHFTSRPVKIIQTSTHFQVTVPLLEVEHL